MAKKVIFVYHWLPHYRSSIFTALSKEYDALFVADATSTYDNLSLMDPTSLQFQKVDNLWFGPLLYQRKLISILRGKSEYRTLVFLADWKFLTTWISLILFKRRYRIGWTHGVNKSERTFLLKIKILYYSLFDEIWTYNESAAKFLREFGIKVNVVYNSNGNDLEMIQKSYDEMSDLLFVGRVLENRRLIEILDFLYVKNSLERRFHIVGSGSHLKALSQYVEQNKLFNKVVIYGPIYEEDRLKAIATKCCLFVHPADIGLSALTALSLGLPVFTHAKWDHHKPEFEAVLQAEAVFNFYYSENMDFNKFEDSLKSLKGLKKDKVRNVLCKWSVSNQVKQIAKSL